MAIDGNHLGTNQMHIQETFQFLLKRDGSKSPIVVQSPISLNDQYFSIWVKSAYIFAMSQHYGAIKLSEYWKVITLNHCQYHSSQFRLKVSKNCGRWWIWIMANITLPHWQKWSKNSSWPAITEPDSGLCRVSRDQKFCP